MTRRVGDHREGQVERLLLVLMGARLALALGSLGLGAALDALGGEVPATSFPGFYVAVAACFVATLVYRPFVGRIRRPGPFAAINVATDLALVSALVLYSGGKQSTFTFLFLVVALYGGVLFPRWGALACSAACSFAYAAVLAIGAIGWGPALPREPAEALLTSWGVHTAALVAAASLAGFLARELVRAGIALDERTQDLEHLRTRHQRTVESLRSGLLTTDLGGRITSFNQEAQRITGLARGDALGREVESVLPGLGSLRCGPLAPDGSSRARMPFAGPDGRAMHLGVGAYVLQDASGAPDGQVVIFQDVTEVVAMERELRRAERLAALGELSASIAHEIRNPLAAISGSIQVLQAEAGAPGGSSKRLMEIVVREVDRLDRLIADFLHYARPGEPRLEPVAVAEAVREVVEMAETAGVGDVALECRVAPGLAVCADPGQLRQVLWNLLLNAVQATAGGGRVRVEAGAGRAPQGEPVADRTGDEGKPAWAEIAVMDQGAGIPPDVAERVFDPFFTTKPGGTGLGLAIVHRVIAEHGGAIRVERGADGFRTAFRVWLPRAEAAQ